MLCTCVHFGSSGSNIQNSRIVLINRVSSRTVTPVEFSDASRRASMYICPRYQNMPVVAERLRERNDSVSFRQEHGVK